MKYDCDYCDLWNIYTEKCNYAVCPLEEGVYDAFEGRGIKPMWETRWEQNATPEEWEELHRAAARDEPTPEEWEELRREHFAEHPEELTQIPPHWRNWRKT